MTLYKHPGDKQFLLESNVTESECKTKENAKPGSHADVSLLPQGSQHTQHSNPQAQMITEVSSEQNNEELPETWWS